MTTREQLTLIAVTVAILLAGALIGSAVVARIDAAAPAPVTDGAVDFSTQPEGDNHG